MSGIAMWLQSTSKLCTEAPMLANETGTKQICICQAACASAMALLAQWQVLTICTNLHAMPKTVVWYDIHVHGQSMDVVQTVAQHSIRSGPL
jgi:hypothetical protein